MMERMLGCSPVEVSARKPGIYISVLQPVKTEVITQTELKKAACCDLAGCFETQGTVQPQTTNVVTNSRELRILGLSGVYNQLLVEGMPLALVRAASWAPLQPRSRPQGPEDRRSRGQQRPLETNRIGYRRGSWHFLRRGGMV